MNMSKLQGIHIRDFTYAEACEQASEEGVKIIDFFGTLVHAWAILGPTGKARAFRAYNKQKRDENAKNRRSTQ